MPGTFLGVLDGVITEVESTEVGFIEVESTEVGSTLTNPNSTTEQDNTTVKCNNVLLDRSIFGLLYTL